MRHTYFLAKAYSASAAIEGDPVDVALELAITIDKPDGVALVNMANDKRPGGDWEAGMSTILTPWTCFNTAKGFWRLKSAFAGGVTLWPL